MEKLFDTSRDFNDGVFRNIVSLRESIDLYSELTEGNAELGRIATAAVMRIKQDIPSGFIERGFHYTTAITYPFEHEPYLSSRYGDGSYSVWYGSMEPETTMAETAHHMMMDEGSIDGLNETITRERALYSIHCHAVLVDLSGKRNSYPELIADDYTFTQPIGRRLQHEGQPGLLAPSARSASGINVVIFNPGVLSNPQLLFYLTYKYNPQSQIVEIEREPGHIYMTYPSGDFRKK